MQKKGGSVKFIAMNTLSFFSADPRHNCLKINTFCSRQNCLLFKWIETCYMNGDCSIWTLLHKLILIRRCLVLVSVSAFYISLIFFSISNYLNRSTEIVFASSSFCFTYFSIVISLFCSVSVYTRSHRMGGGGPNLLSENWNL